VQPPWISEINGNSIIIMKKSITCIIAISLPVNDNLAIATVLGYHLTSSLQSYITLQGFLGITSGVNVWQHILHDWDDEKCIQILRNCMRALPDHGKVILSESVVSELEDNDEYTVFTASFDLTMLTQLEGGMEVAWSAPKANGQSSWVMLALLGFNSCSLVRRKGLTSGSLSVTLQKANQELAVGL
jgi:hypothetical protein